MAGRFSSSPSPHSSTTHLRSRSPLLLFTLSIIGFSLLLLLFSLSSSTSLSPPPFYPTRPPETSFLISLEHFLSHTSSPPAPRHSAPAVPELDGSVFRSESRRLYAEPYYPLDLPLKIYVYEMPPKFTYDLLRLFHDTYKQTSNLTSNGSPVHRLIQQHSVDYWLWADLIAPESKRLLKNVLRVHHQEDADLFYIPFFTTISFFLLEKQQCKSLYRVKL